MPSQDHLVEQAFDAARSGSCRTIGDIEKVLKKGGATAASIELHLAGRHIRAQLRAICNEAYVDRQAS